MEKTLAREIYKRMEIGKAYSTTELFDLLGDDYFKIVPQEMHPYQPQGKPVNAIISEEMWKVVKSGFAKTYKGEQTLALVGGLKKGATPTCYRAYSFRYWIRTK